MHFAKPSAQVVVANLVGAIFCSATSIASAQEPLKLAGSQLEPVKWTELAGWSTDDHLAAFAAYQASCRALGKIPHPQDHRPIYHSLWNVCRRVLDLRPQDSDTARAFFEENFEPVRIARLGEVEGFLTGYFEPIVQGSRHPIRSSMSRSIAARLTWSQPATNRGLKHFQTRVRRSVVAMRRASSYHTMTAPQSRPVRSMARTLKSAGSRSHLTCLRSKFKVRDGSFSRMERRYASTTTRITAIHMPRSAVRPSSAVLLCDERSPSVVSRARIRTQLRKCVLPTVPMCSSASSNCRTRVNRSARRGCR